VQTFSYFHLVTLACILKRRTSFFTCRTLSYKFVFPLNLD
jgi:hypothetical protein